jgi:hypothetical protein
MELPNASSVEVSREKIVGYLLNPGHPDGAGKAAFFFARLASVWNAGRSWLKRSRTWRNTLQYCDPWNLRTGRSIL